VTLLETLKKLTDGLAKTREALVGKLHRLARAKSKIDREFLDQLEEILLSADVGVETASKIIDGMQKKALDTKYENTEELELLLRDQVDELLGVNGKDTDVGESIPRENRPHVIMVVGVNGAGKTTTIGKLAYRHQKAGRRVVVGAADTFRAAANEQLEIWAQRAGVEIIRQRQGADPAAVAYDAITSAVAKKADVVIIDTAGRLHTKTNLMEELGKIKRVMAKRLVGAPHEVLLVIDAGTGQNGLQQARQFMSEVGVTGLVLTKLDGTAKGGIILSICNEMQIPVKYVGVGEGLDDLQPFSKQHFVSALFGENSFRNEG